MEMPEDAITADITEHAENFIAENGDKYVNTDARPTGRTGGICTAEEHRRSGTGSEKYRIVYDNWFGKAPCIRMDR
ncbi:MAG: hypothetical protein ACLR5S_10765 [Ruminococcus sp.]